MKKTILFFTAMLVVFSIALAQNKSQVKVSQKHFTETLNPEQSVTKTITITNMGQTDITFDVANIETSSGIVLPSQGNSIDGDGPNDFINHLSYLAENGAYSASWLALNSPKNTLSSNESVKLELNFNAAGLTSGIYNAHILITTNDAGNPYIDIPITISIDNGRAPLCQAFQTTDNENNAGTGVADNDVDAYLFNYYTIAPIELNLFLDEPAPITSAQLSIYAYDIDETAGEIDHVYFNGHFLGPLTGNDDQWSTTVFAVDPTWVVAGPSGKNLVRVDIDVNNEGWAVEVDWGQLMVNGCSAGNAYLRYVNLDKPNYLPSENIQVTTEVDTDLPSQNVRLETNFLNPSMVDIDGTIITYPISLTQNEPQVNNFTVPASAVLGSTYYLQTIVYDAQTNLQQDIQLKPILITDNPPSVPLSDWAIYIAIMLIGIAIFYRFKTRIA